MGHPSSGTDVRHGRRLRMLLLVTLTALSSIAATNPYEDAGDYPPKDTIEASILRGDIVFHNYCILCHGVNADGQGRAARLYNPKPANLRKSMVPDSYKEMIIRKGGAAMGRSKFMPPWGEELTDEQIADLVNYLRSVAPRDAAK